MHTAYYKEYSHSLGRDMEFMVYGHSEFIDTYLKKC